VAQGERAASTGADRASIRPPADERLQAPEAGGGRALIPSNQVQGWSEGGVAKERETHAAIKWAWLRREPHTVIKWAWLRRERAPDCH